MVAFQLFRLIPSAFNQRFNGEKLGVRGWLRSSVQRRWNSFDYFLFDLVYRNSFAFIGISSSETL